MGENDVTQFYANYRRTLRIVDLIFGGFNIISIVPFVIAHNWGVVLLIISFFVFNATVSIASNRNLIFLSKSHSTAKLIEQLRHALGAPLAVGIYIWTGWWQGLLILALGGAVQFGILLQRPQIGRWIVFLYSLLFVTSSTVLSNHDFEFTFAYASLGLMVGLTFVEINAFLGKTLIDLQGRNVLITEKNDQLQALYNEIDNVIHVVAHDLRSPISRIKGLAQIIEMVDPKERKEIIFKIVKTSDHGLEIVNDLLSLHSDESAALDFEDVDILHLLKNEILPDFANSLAVKGMRVELRSSGTTVAKTSRKCLLRIFGNLLSNAIKYSAPGKQILISVASHGDHMLINVTDQGPGFTDADKKLVFKKFQRLSARPTANESSTGLGLYIVNELVKEISGSITFESEEGKGTTFEISLPQLPLQ